MSPRPSYNRCRPSLGTFVQISLVGGPSLSLEEAGEEAFRMIKQVDTTMSFHDSKSELSRLNRAPVKRWIRVSRQLHEVLAFALDLQGKSQGLFNVAIGRPLVAWKILPGRATTPGFEHLHAPGFELRGDLARRLSPVRLDLGGVAKGYAVDAAVERLRQLVPSASGCVNAGGDLRVFGDEEMEIWVRGSGKSPRLYQTRLHDCALATSSITPRGRVSAYVNPHYAGPCLRRRSVSVMASRCMVADALTKVALLAQRDTTQRVALDYDARIEEHS